MNSIIKQRIKELQNEVVELRKIIRVLNYDILFRNLIITELRQLHINYYCYNGINKLNEIERLEKIIEKGNSLFQ
ncbi:hypothetical protein MPF19_16690 [Polaribacter sp. Z014]|nr:hypothetical protein [Polaribacter sp. Z014]